ncbi:MAG: hypothetical protein KGS00_14045 [Alphaproteobacteria bacterium]|jgi:hypothetical protein|nr:hypothetical protein [Alphaproteobacteria bacterium]
MIFEIMDDRDVTTEVTKDFRILYRQAFDAFGTAALWNKARIENPSPEHALIIARALRIEGDRRARQLAEDIERAVRGSDRAAE